LKKNLNIALVGNPNCGKSTLFNCLTGLKQKTGNFPGVTVDKLEGRFGINETLNANIVDLPGTYSLYPKREDEWIVYETLLGVNDNIKPDLILLVADASNLKRNLLFCSQIIDLKVPVVLVLTMMDLAKQKGTKIDIAALQRALGVPIVAANPRKGVGIADIKKSIALTQTSVYQQAPIDFINIETFAPEAIAAVCKKYDVSNYKALQILIHHAELFEELDNKKFFAEIETKFPINKTQIQGNEILARYGRIKQIMQQSVVENDELQKSLFTKKLDDVLLHKHYGYLIFIGVLFLLFQSLFWLAQYPMDWVEQLFAFTNGWLNNKLPNTYLTDLFINGLVAGLSGILVFVPQIMILFGLINILEDTGYMARMSFLSDRLMRSVGLNGKSVVPMISGFACAVPAIMSARNIENKKERLLTILITPLMSCSARLPVYSILISLVIPNYYVLGFINIKGLVMLGLYLLGIILALVISSILNKLIKIKERTYFLLELPVYRIPRWQNVFTTMLTKARIFVFEAGKVIMIISIVLWFLSSFGPSGNNRKIIENSSDSTTTAATFKLENSYAGQIGKWIEPVIQPLGYDWRIGIALVTSFAAREVFVGTMATLYSVGEGDDDALKLSDKMRNAVDQKGNKIYTLATGISLMIFYALAMQCMSTLAIVKRETKSWKWPILQFTLLTALAYLLSFIAYQILK
jgi:ferrous iron transport protein B